jgi:hypothetical protein
MATRNFIMTVINLISNNQVEEDETGGACSTNGEEEVVGGKARGKETARKIKTYVGG